MIVCSDCKKTYKTRGGFERHRASKHGQQVKVKQLILTEEILREIVNSAMLSMREKKIYSVKLRNEMDISKFQGLEEIEFRELKCIFDGLVKNGDSEKFFSKYYATIALESTRFFKGFSQHSAALLAIKVAENMLAYYKRQKSVSTNNADCNLKLSEREKAGLQYIGGYVLQKIHNRHRAKASHESQQAQAILKAGKSDKNDSTQKLVESVNRGGLWFISEPSQIIFLKTEQYFRRATSTPGLTKVDIAGIAQESISDCDVLSNYNLILAEAELEPDKHVEKDVLHNIVSLYVRVRAFSFAKDIIQRYKIKSKQTKAKSLRKEISRSCQDTEDQRNE